MGPKVIPNPLPVEDTKKLGMPPREAIFPAQEENRFPPMMDGLSAEGMPMPEKGAQFRSILPGVDIPTRDAIMTQPIDQLKVSLNQAFTALCNYIEPFIPYLKPIAFHGTSKEGADAFHKGEAPRDSRLWVGAVEHIPPTTPLLVRDLLNAARTGAHFSVPSLGTPNGALLVIKMDGREITACPLVDDINQNDAYLRIYSDKNERRGGLAKRKDIGERFNKPGQLNNAIADVISWADSPYADIPIQEDLRRSVLLEALAFFAVAKIFSDFNNSPFRTDKPIERQTIDELQNKYESLPDGRLIDRQKSSIITIIDQDRVVFVPREPSQLGRFIGETFTKVTDEAFTLMREALRNPDYLPPQMVAEAVVKWQSLAEYRHLSLEEIMEAFLGQYTNHLDQNNSDR